MHDGVPAALIVPVGDAVGELDGVDGVLGYCDSEGVAEAEGVCEADKVWLALDACDTVADSLGTLD